MNQSDNMNVPNDVRPELRSLVRELDRLPPGEYTVKLDKPQLKGIPWRMRIEKTETIRDMDLKR